jgi:DNA-binding transcriptional LysR family regulator
MTLDLRDLEVFLAVARRGSFGRAANELLVSQPAVSERVRNLERALGARVFERTTRGAALTPAGEQLLPYAQRCTALAEEAVAVVQQHELHPRLVVAVHSTFAPRVVPLVLGALAGLPRRIAVRDAHSHEAEALVIDGVADVGFAIPAGARRGLRRVALPPDPVVCVVAPGHPLERAKQPSVDALTAAVLAVNAWGDGADAFVARLTAVGVEEWRIRLCGDAATAVTLARDHGHVAFVTQSTVAHDVRAKRLRAVDLAGMPRWNVRLDLLHRTSDRTDTAIRAILNGLA